MKRTGRYISALIGTALVLIPILVNAEKIPMTAWIHDPLIASVNVSPDGNKLVALTLSNVNEAADITVWDSNNLSAPPTRFKPRKTKALFVTWLNNDRLFVIGRMKYDYQIGARTTHWFRDYAYIVDEKGKRFRELFKSKEDDIASVSLFDSLPQQPDKILVQTTNLEFAQDIYEVDLKSFTSKRIFRGATGEDYFTDAQGVIRGRS